MLLTISELLKQSSALLAVSDTPRLDVEILLGYVLGKDRSFLYTWPEHPLNTDQLHQFQRLFARRLNGEPVAHLTGLREFWSLSLKVSPVTLIPRPETELLVELALGLRLGEKASVLDLGTGTGAIALALASEKQHWNISAVDASAAAVALAEENREQLGFNHVQVFQSDWFSNLAEEQFDLIVGNPPYICANDQHLSQGDVRFEPSSALVADESGLADIRTIVAGADSHLKHGGWLMLEHGYEQAGQVREVMLQAGYCNVATHIDLAGLDRVTVCCKAWAV